MENYRQQVFGQVGKLRMSILTNLEPHTETLVLLEMYDGKVTSSYSPVCKIDERKKVVKVEKRTVNDFK